MLDQLLRVMKRLHAEQDINVQSRIEPRDIIFKGEMQDLQEILGNILDNAYK